MMIAGNHDDQGRERTVALVRQLEHWVRPPVLVCEEDVSPWDSVSVARGPSWSLALHGATASHTTRMVHILSAHHRPSSLIPYNRSVYMTYLMCHPQNSCPSLCLHYPNISKDIGLGEQAIITHIMCTNTRGMRVCGALRTVMVGRRFETTAGVHGADDLRSGDATCRHLCRRTQPTCGDDTEDT